AGLRQTFEASREIDPVAEDVTVFDNDVALMNPHAEFDALVGWYVGVALGHAALHLDGAAHRIDDTGELREQTVAGGFDDAAAVLGNLRVAEFAPDRLQCRERPFLVRAHQPRIAGDIGRQYRRQPPLSAIRFHCGRLPQS